LRPREAIAKMGRIFLSHPADSQDLASSSYHLFGSVKDALCGRHFVDYNEVKQSFREVLRSRSKEFYNNSIQRLTQRWKICVENDRDFVENSLIVAKGELFA
jgi:hypothetical protein